MAISGYDRNKYKLSESDTHVLLEKIDGSASSPSSPNMIEFAKPASDGNGGWSGVEKYQANLAAEGLTDDFDYSPTYSAGKSSGGSGYSGGYSGGVSGFGGGMSLGGKPSYTSSYSGQIDALLGKIMNREDFSYDYKEDPLYEQYRDIYTREGNLAMRDTMGAAAALTGGYGNSYGTTAGSQAYQQHLGRLNDVVLDLEQLAYQKYRDVLTDQYNQMNTLRGLESDEYGRYRDEVSDYYADYDRAYQSYADSLSQSNYEREFAYQQERDSIADKQWQAELDWAKESAANELAYKYAMANMKNSVSGGSGTGGKETSTERLADDLPTRNSDLGDAEFLAADEALAQYSQVMDTTNVAKQLDKMMDAKYYDNISDYQWATLMNRYGVAHFFRE